MPDSSLPPSSSPDLLALLEHSGGGYTVFDSAFRIAFEGPANQLIHGYAPSELFGRSLMEFLHPEDLERLGARFQRILVEPGAIDNDTVRFRHKDGRWLTLEGYIRNCLDDPRVGGLLNTFSDVSARAAAQDELRRAKEAAEEFALRQKRFLGQVSHEFRTPLTLVRLPIAALQQQLAATPAAALAADNCRIALRNLDRLEALVSELVDLSRVDSHETVLRFAENDLVAFLKTQIELYQTAAAQTGVNLIWEGPLACRLFFDAAQLQKVVANLLSNALRHTPASGRIYLRCAVSDADELAPRVTISVADTGEGMTEDVRARAFERFFQGPRFGAEPSGGMGIGLCLVKELVELHGGSITLRSEPGQGTEVAVQLPLTSDHIALDELSRDNPSAESAASAELTNAAPILAASSAAASASPFADEPPAEPLAAPDRTLLIVEDTRDLRVYLRNELASAYRILEAADGLEALAQIDARHVDLVLSDVMMPRLDGLAFCRALASRATGPRPPVVLLSAKDQTDDRAAGLAAGAADYLGKPFNLRELRLRLGKACPPRPRADETPAHAAEWLANLETIVAQNLSNEQLGTTELAAALRMSPRQLQRRLQDLAGETPAAFVRRQRLLAARDRIERRAFVTMSEVAVSVGMSVSYFYRAYRAYFGAPPAFPTA